MAFKVLKVLILDTDYYARQAINSYLAWDRRTRVVHLADTLESVVEYMERTTDSSVSARCTTRVRRSHAR